MVTGKLKDTAKPSCAKLNSAKLSFLAMLVALVVAAAMFFSALFPVKTPKDRVAANKQQAPAQDFTSNPTPLAPTRTTEQAREAYGQMPLSFEANHGQAGDSVNFVARGAGYTLALSPAAAVFQLRNETEQTAISKQQSAVEESGMSNRWSRTQHSALTTQHSNSQSARSQSTVLRMKLVGANAAARAAGQNELEGKVNYFIGSDPAKWRTDVPTFGRVRYTEVYPGIDVVYYGNQRRLEYDFVVAPGRDARAIALEFAGAQKIEVDAANGDLLVRVGEETIRQLAPITYQETETGRREVESRYALRDGGHVGFEVGEYDSSAPLVIDPVLQYSTYLGGNGEDAPGRSFAGIAVDSAGNAFITGETKSTNFPTVNPIQSTFGGNVDLFVTKINAAGTAVVYSTYLGGSAYDVGIDIGVDSAGNTYITGNSLSSNFPTVNPIPGTNCNAGGALVTKLNAAGSALVYSTCLGSGTGSGIAVDSSGNAYVTGSAGASFPTVNAFDSTNNGGGDAFLTKINAAGTSLVYSTYLGGNGLDEGFGIASDSAGNAYVTGWTASANFPLLNPIQSTRGDSVFLDVFVTKINAAGTAIVYSTFLGGNNLDYGLGIAVDSAGNAYVTGDAYSTNFPTANAFKATTDGVVDTFVTKINASGSALVYSTYLGGNSHGSGIAADSSGNAYVTGYTSSTNFPTVNPIQGTYGGGDFDAYVTKINAAGSALVYSTFLGGSGVDQGYGIALDSAGNAYIAGFTSSCFPTTTGAFDTTNNGGGDAFVSKISETAPPSTLTPITSTFQFAQATYPVAEDVNFVTVTVTRTGNTSAAATVDFATSNGTASERRDYTTALGTLRFAAGETAKTFDLLVNEDSYVEGQETFSVTLSNPSVGGCLGVPSTASVQITDDASEPSTNVIDDPQTFVGTHYHDFLNRQHDTPGFNFWTNEITLCGASAACTDFKRQSVSGAFFVSIEFQQTGLRVINIYKATFPDTPARPRGLPRYREFMRDLREIHRGAVVGQGNWEQQLEVNNLDFAREWLGRSDVLALFPADMTAEQFVDKLFLNAQVTPTPGERDAAISAFGAGDTDGRARALLSVVASGSVFNRQFNSAFVSMQYFGYLRRSPDDAPDTSFEGYDYWLNKLNAFNVPGEDVREELTARSRIQRAEMVRAFIISTEYRARFGP